MLARGEPRATPVAVPNDPSVHGDRRLRRRGDAQQRRRQRHGQGWGVRTSRSPVDSTRAGACATGAAATAESCFAACAAARAASPRPRPSASAATTASAPNAPAAATHRGCRVHRRHQSLTMSTPVCTATPATGVGIITVASTLGFVTRDFRDATGRDTLVTSPIDSAQAVFTSSRTVYTWLTARPSHRALGRRSVSRSPGLSPTAPLRRR